MTAILLLLLFLAAAAAVGRRILDLLRLADVPALERLVYSIAFGLGAIGYYVLLVGLLGYLRPLPVLLGVAVLVMIAWPGARLALADVREAVHVGRWSLGATLAGLVFAAAGAVVLVSCFVPPGSHEWDALSYHLAAPKVYLQHGRIVYIPTDHHTNFPFLVQMLFTLGLMVHGLPLAQLFHASTWALLIVMTWSVGERRFSPHAGRIAALVVASTPIFVWEAGAPYIDVAYALYALLAVAAAIEYRATRRPGWLVASALSVGFCLSVKTLAVTLFAALLGWLLLRALCSGRQARRVGIRHAALFALVGGIVGSPFYIKSWVQTGNPVYPFAYRLFGGRDWNQSLADAYSNQQVSFGLGTAAPTPLEDLAGRKAEVGPKDAATRMRHALLAPFGLVALPRLFYDPQDFGVFTHLGYLWLALPPLLLIAGGSSASVLVGGLALVLLLIWSQSMQYVRYAMPLVPLFALLGGDAAARLWRSSRFAAGAVGVVLAVQCLLCLGYFLPQVPALLAIARSKERQEKYLTSQVNVYAAQRWINLNAPADAGVVLFEEARGLYLDRPYLWGNSFHSLYIPYDTFQSSRQMVDWFLNHGVRYALVNLQFSPYMTGDNISEYRMAVRSGDVINLFLRLYQPGKPGDERWRGLLGDALRSGDAVFVPEASVRGVVTLAFRPREMDR